MTPEEFRKQAEQQGYWPQYRQRLKDLLKRQWPQGSAEIQARNETIKAMQDADDERRRKLTDESGPAADSSTDNARASYLNDVHWVYQNIDLDEAQRTPPPSPGALYLLRIAKEDSKVLREPLMMLARKTEVDKTEQAIRADCRKSREEIRRILDKIGNRV